MLDSKIYVAIGTCDYSQYFMKLFEGSNNEEF